MALTTKAERDFGSVLNDMRDLGGSNNVQTLIVVAVGGVRCLLLCSESQCVVGAWALDCDVERFSAWFAEVY